MPSLCGGTYSCRYAACSTLAQLQQSGNKTHSSTAERMERVVKDTRKTYDKMKRKISAYYKLSRPFNALSGAIAVLLGGYVAATERWTSVLLAALATVLITASSNAWNDYLDVEIDRINQPQRVIPAGLLTRGEALRFSLAMALFSLLLGALISWPSFFMVLGSNLLLFLYSLRLKSTVLIGNATVAAVSAASIVFGGVAAGNAWPSISLAICIGMVMMMREILKTMADYEGDLSENVKTIATVWGVKAACMLFFLSALMSLILLFIPPFVGEYSLAYLAIIIVGVCPVLLYVLTQVRPSTPASRLERLSQLIKYDFMVWFLAVWVGSTA